MTPKRGTRVVGYVGVSTTEQADSGAGLEAQRHTITQAAETRGWELVDILEDAGLSGKTTNGWKGLTAALALVEAGAANAIVAAKVDRIACSPLDFATILKQAERAGWSLGLPRRRVRHQYPVRQGHGADARVVCELERSMISQRTKDALAVKKAAGVRLGRPRNVPDRVFARIRREKAAGASLSAIARGLNTDAIPTSQGGSGWHAPTVKKLLAQEEVTE